MRLATKIFAGAALVVVAALGAALLVTRSRADAAAQAASARALARHPLGHRRRPGEPEPELCASSPPRWSQVPAYVSRIGEALRTDDRANLLDQADELRAQTGADWVLIVDDDRRAQGLDRRNGTPSTRISPRGALIGRALEGRTTEGLWIESGAERDELYQAVGVPVTDPAGGARYGVVVAALRIDSSFAAQLKRHTDSEILFFSRDTAGVPGLAVSTAQRVRPRERGAPAPGRSPRRATRRRSRSGSPPAVTPTRA